MFWHYQFPLCTISTTDSVEINSNIFFLVAQRESTVETHRKSVTSTTADTGMLYLFYFIRYVIFFPLSKEIPDQNNFTNKIRGYFVMINWDFLF